MDVNKSSKRKVPLSSSCDSSLGKHPRLSSSTQQHNSSMTFVMPTKTHQYTRTELCLVECRKAILDVAIVLKKEGCLTLEAVRICKELDEICVFVDNSRLRLSAMFIGLMASGKSSLIEKLIGILNLTGSVNDGSSGTGVIQVYMNMPPSTTNTSPLIASIILYSPKKREALMREYIAMCYKALKYMDDDDCDEGEQDDWRKKYNSALGFLQPILCHWPDFQTKKKLEGWLRKERNTNETEVCKILSRHVEDYLSTITTDFSAEDAAILRAQTWKSCRAETDSSGNPESSPCSMIWKAVFKVSNSELLKQEIDLIDTPGTNDANQHRAQLSTISLQEDCKVRVLVEESSRVIDKIEFQTLVRKHWDKADFFAIAVTKIDTAILNPARSGLNQKEKDDLAALESQKEDLQKAARENERKMDEDATEMEQARLYREARDIQRKLKNITNETRNKEIVLVCKGLERRMQQQFQEITKSTVQANIFFVSCKPDANDSGNLASLLRTAGLKSVEELGDLLTLVFPRTQVNHLKHLCRVTFPHLVNSLDVVCRRPLLERKHEVETYVSKPTHSSYRAVDRTVLKIKKIINTLSCSLRSHAEVWKEESLPIVEGWATCRAGTYAAFCRRGGKWKLSKGEPLISWNQDLLELSNNTIKNLFVNVESQLKREMADLGHDIDPLLSNVRSDVEQDNRLMGLDMSHFFEYLDSSKEKIRSAVTELEMRLLDRVNLIKDRLVPPELKEEESYLHEHMHEAYEKCALIAGLGSFNQRRREMRDAVAGNEDVFSQITTQASDDLDDAIERWHKSARKHLSRPFQDALTTFQDSFSETDVGDETTTVLREKFLPVIEETKRRIREELLPLVKQLDEMGQVDQADQSDEDADRLFCSP